MYVVGSLSSSILSDVFGVKMVKLLNAVFCMILPSTVSFKF